MVLLAQVSFPLMFFIMADCSDTKPRQAEIVLNDVCEGNRVKVIAWMNVHGCSVHSAAKGSRSFGCKLKISAL